MPPVTVPCPKCNARTMIGDCPLKCHKCGEPINLVPPSSVSASPRPPVSASSSPWTPGTLPPDNAPTPAPATMDALFADLNAEMQEPSPDVADLVDAVDFEDDPMHAAGLVAAGAGEISLAALRFAHDSMDAEGLNLHRAALRAAALKTAALALRIVRNIDHYSAF